MKKEFSHTVIQDLYNGGVLFDQIQTNEELINKIVYYGQYDVIATALIFHRYKKALKSYPATENYAWKITDYITSPSMMYDIWNEYLEGLDVSKFNLPGEGKYIKVIATWRDNINSLKRVKIKKYQHPMSPLELFKSREKFRIGGRVDCFGRKRKLDDCVQIDLCSAYLYSMVINNVEYPYGNPFISDVERPELLGEIYCDIDQSELWKQGLKNIIPKITETDNDWEHQEILTDYLITSIDYYSLKHHGCKVTFKKAWYYPYKIRSYDLFKPLASILKGKLDQDKYMESNPELYNASLRFIFKLLGNSLSGKLNEGLHEEKSEMVQSLSRYYEIKDKYDNINVVNITNSFIFLNYTNINPNSIKRQKPTVYGSFIYAYSRQYMYFSTQGFKYSEYTDTDSSLLTKSRFEEWVNIIQQRNVNIPHVIEAEEIDPRYKTHLLFESNSKLPGSYSIEFKADKAIILGKKSYCLKNENELKMRLSGINKESVLIEESKVEEVKQYSNLKTYQLYNSSPKIKDNAYELFEQLFQTNKAYFLCQVFLKHTGNNFHNVGIENSERFNRNNISVQVRRVIKELIYEKSEATIEREKKMSQLINDSLQLLT